jgi:NAD(P)H-flavin reductase
MKEFSLTLSQKIKLTADIIELRFVKPAEFEFLAGQFVQLLIPHEGGVTRRSYSIANSPDEAFLEFVIKILPNGVGSQFLGSLREGDTVTGRGPLGHFVNNGNDNSICFVATGVGLAPIYGIILETLRNKKNTNSVHLYFGVRSESDIFWLERLETLAREYDNFSYTFTLSQPSTTWNGATGRVTAHLPHHSVTDNFYLCGSPEMVKEVRESLIDRGAEPTKIKFEIF